MELGNFEVSEQSHMVLNSLTQIHFRRDILSALEGLSKLIELVAAFAEGPG